MRMICSNFNLWNFAALSCEPRGTCAHRFAPRNGAIGLAPPAGKVGRPSHITPDPKPRCGTTRPRCAIAKLFQYSHLGITACTITWLISVGPGGAQQRYLSDPPGWTDHFGGFSEYYGSNYTPDHRGWRTRIAFKYVGPDELSRPINNIPVLFASITVGVGYVETISNLVVYVFERESEQTLLQKLAPFMAAPIRDAKSVDEAIAAGRPCALFANVDDGATTQAVVAIRAELTARHKLSCAYQLIRESFGFKPLRQILDDNHRTIMLDQMAVYMISRK